MIKITTNKFSGVELKAPKEAFIWLNAKEVESDKVAIIATVHHTAAEAIESKEKKTDQVLSINLMIPPQEIIMPFDFAQVGNFRQLNHEAFLVELLKVNKDILTSEILL